MLLTSVIGCGGETTGIARHVDGGDGGDASTRGSTGGVGGASAAGGSVTNSGGSPGETDACACSPIICAPHFRSVVPPGTCCPSCEPCGPLNCAIVPECGPGQEPQVGLGECCPTSCGPVGTPAPGTCLGIPCSDTHACWCNDGAVVIGIACGARGTCEVCATNGLNDPCLGRPPDSPEGPDCCPGLTCVNNRCVP